LAGFFTLAVIRVLALKNMLVLLFRDLIGFLKKPRIIHISPEKVSCTKTGYLNEYGLLDKFQ
jgi:hypothetical protein